jgi:hypothetical protein
MSGSGQFGYRLDSAEFVVRVHDGDEHRVFSEGGLQVLDVDDSVCARPEVSDIVTVLFKQVRRPQDCVVLERGHDHVSTLGGDRARYSDYCRIVRLCPTAREDNLARLSSTDRPSDTRTCILECIECLPADSVQAVRVTEQLREVRSHRVQNARIDRSRSRVIEIHETVVTHATPSFPGSTTV